MTQTQHSAFIGVLLPKPLAAQLKAAAAADGKTQSDILRVALARDLLARDLATMTNPKRPAQPAQ